ncbi:hypothetical protein GYMLUDRAFT_95973 [Collybiopsis luxurians FD-317 M1]|uniref:Uncharacterized protein n=1 Tax=Collybiopsis luxurians FD-317 M1 TaxID=944289 RepID=A0A0D0BEY0_9AGAR|nr:hypothetical protein GYMLUDRAFT_95973 [Collybiopsis luxurians FD-317 M1]
MIQKSGRGRRRERETGLKMSSERENRVQKNVQNVQVGAGFRILDVYLFFSAESIPEPTLKTIESNRSKSKATMPGSLFPRSPSLMPSEVGHSDRDDSRQERRTSWNFGFDQEEEAGPSSPKSPFRPPQVSSVRDAVIKFRTDADVDPNILLPSPSRRKGKEREVDEDSVKMPPPPIIRHEGDSSREIRFRGKERELSEARELHMEKEKRWERDRDKGSLTGKDALDEEKGREEEREKDKERIRNLEKEVERLQEELRRRPMSGSAFLSPPPPPPPPPPPLPALSISVRSELNSSSSSAPFAFARAALKHAPAPVEAPINPPRRHAQPTVGITADKMAAFLKEMKTVRLRKVGSQSSLGKSTSDSSRRESFGDDNSRSIGDLERSRLSISDLRTTKETQGDRAAGPSSVLMREPSWPSTRSVSSNGDGDASQRKRKRTVSIDESEEGADDLSIQIQKLRESMLKNAKQRRILEADTSFTSTSTSNPRFRPLPSTSSSQSRHSASFEDSSSFVLPEGTSFPSRAWGSVSSHSRSDRDSNTNQSVPPPPSIDTPSLCSDNDAEMDPERPGHEADSSTPPSTPPGVTANFAASPKYVDLEVGIKDAEDEQQTGPSMTKQQKVLRSSPHPNAYSAAKRVPASPLPNPSPKRPKPPARSRTGTRPRPPTPPRKLPTPQDESDDGEGEDPLLLSFDNGEEFVSASVSTSSQPTRKSGRRRSTLDEELRAAHKASLMTEVEGDWGEDELESGMYVGTGVRSKKHGFMAHGGAGGVPVWMGEGYVLGVDGAEEEAEPEEEKSGSFILPSRIPVLKTKSARAMKGR